MEYKYTYLLTDCFDFCEECEDELACEECFDGYRPIKDENDDIISCTGIHTVEQLPHELTAQSKITQLLIDQMLCLLLFQLAQLGVKNALSALME